MTPFQGTPDSVDGALPCFPVKRFAKGVEDLPGFLGMFDFADRKAGRAVIVTLWATEEACAASAEFARKATKRLAEEGAEEVLSVREYEVGYYLLSDSLSRRW